MPPPDNAVMATIAISTAASVVTRRALTTTFFELFALYLEGSCYDGSSSRKLIKDKGAITLIPPPKNARIKGFDPNRDDVACIIRGLSGDSKARSLWGRCIGYSQRSLVESAFSRMKRLFSKRFDAQRVENHPRCMILNVSASGEKHTFSDFYFN